MTTVKEIIRELKERFVEYNPQEATLKFFIDGEIFTEEEMTVSRVEKFYKCDEDEVGTKSGDYDEVLIYLTKDVQYLKTINTSCDKVPNVVNGKMIGWKYEKREHHENIHGLLLDDMSVINIHAMGINPIKHEYISEVI